MLEYFQTFSFKTVIHLEPFKNREFHQKQAQNWRERKNHLPEIRVSG